MKQNVLALLIATSMAGCASSAPYIAVGGGVGEFGTQDSPGSYTDVNLTARLGYDVGKYFGVEAEGSVNIGGSVSSSRTGLFAATESSEQADNHLGIFLRGKIPVSDRVSFFARAGLGRRKSTSVFRSADLNELDGINFEATRNFSVTDFFGALGGGAEYAVTKDKRNAIRAEFTGYNIVDFGGDDDDDALDDSVFTLSYVRKF